MTLTITELIKVILTKAEFNNGCEMYRRLKELLQPSGKKQFMQLTREYYIFLYKHFPNIMEFLNQIQFLEKQIDARKVTMTQDKQTILCLIMALLDVMHFCSLIQI